ncbi:hypothetical protein [Arthrobacter sp. H20]|uniref:hypothetical protein n=1 Tax=Arthrobacter sp. H20 TaxID=1267981 RepID=UPI00047D32E1|nr:hypothetical protein [Arthrobacter sp. H20]
MGDIERAALGKWERIGYLAQFGAVIPTQIVSQVLESAGFGWWEGIGLALLICLALGYLVSRPLIAERSQRVALDLSRGIFDCAIRYPNSHPGSLCDRWNSGVAKAEANELLFQPQLIQGDPNPTSMAVPRDLGILSTGQVIDQEGKRPAEVVSGWKFLKYTHNRAQCRSQQLKQHLT